MSETPQYKGIKKLLETKLKEWFGLSITEYPSSGHELDIVGLTSEGVKIYIEVIWSHSTSQFYRNMSMLQQSDADAKVVVGSPEILANPNMLREFTKVAVSETEKGGCIHPEILNGEKILSTPEYVEKDLKGWVTSLVDRASKKLDQKKSIPKPHFEQKLSEIMIPIAEDDQHPRIQILLGPIANGDKYLEISRRNASLFQGSLVPGFLGIRECIPRRDRYDFKRPAAGRGFAISFSNDRVLVAYQEIQIQADTFLRPL